MTLGELTEVADGVYVRPMITISDAIDLFDGHLAQRGRTDRTRDSYLRTLDKFCDRFPNHWDVAKVTADDCEKFLAQWRNRSLGTQAQVYAPLNGLFGFLYRTRKIRQNPMEFIDPPVRQRPEDLDVVTVSTNDVRRLLAAAQTWPERLAIGVAAYLGPRRRAIAMARLEDYDYERQTLTFAEKGRKTITKPVPDELAALIQAADLAGAFKGPEFYLVPPEGDLRKEGERDDRVIWRLVKKVAERAGVRTHVHALRAAFACFYLENNPGDVAALQALMGHKSLTTTQVYLRKLDRAQAMERVRSLSWGAQTNGGQIEGSRDGARGNRSHPALDGLPAVQSGPQRVHRPGEADA